jgi:hypothetical protein
LRVISRLSIGIEIHFVNAGLSRRAWLAVPYAGVQLDLAEFLHREATPDASAFWRQRLGTITTSSELVAQYVTPT